MGVFSNSIVGVDIGSTAVRVVEVDEPDASGYVSVKRAGIAELPDGAVIAGEIRKSTVVAAALIDAFKSSGISRSRRCVVGLSSKKVAIGRVEVPDVLSADERTKVIRSTAENIAPQVPMDESALSWNELRVEQRGQRSMAVLNTAAAVRSAVEEIEQLSRTAEIDLRAVDLVAAALLRSVVRIPEDDTTVSTVVDIGATSTIVATREGPTLRSLRLISEGGQQATRALANGLGIEVAAAEQQKKYIRVSGDIVDVTEDSVAQESLVPTSTPEDLLIRATDRIIEEVAVSIQADTRANPSNPTQGIQLVGGGSRLPGLTERLSAAIGIPAARSTAWADISNNRKMRPLVERYGEPRLVEDLAVAIGLALWKVPQ